MMFASSNEWLKVSLRITTVLFVALFCVQLSASDVFGQAQANAADLRGVVRDATGAVVSGATVTARNPATSTTKDATSNEEGAYQIVSLPPGVYEVTVEAPNFKKAVLPAVTLTVGQSADLDVALEVGQVSEIVTITGATTELV